MYDVNKLRVINIDRDTAKKIVLENHYMKTFPAGAKIYFGILHEGFEGIQGVAVFGYSSSTLAKTKLFENHVKPNEIIEMQRLWISDKMLKNAESKTLSLIADKFKEHAPHLKIIFTYAGGCKDDCGIVYQSSGFLYLFSEKCDDFYLTKNGEYKNIISALRFGKAPKGMKDKNEIAKYLFGEGHFINAHRHFYFLPLNKAIRRKLTHLNKPFPKHSAQYRLNQEWVSDNGAREGLTGAKSQD